MAGRPPKLTSASEPQESLALFPALTATGHRRRWTLLDPQPTLVLSIGSCVHGPSALQPPRGKSCCLLQTARRAGAERLAAAQGNPRTFHCIPGMLVSRISFCSRSSLLARVLLVLANCCKVIVARKRQIKSSFTETSDPEACVSVVISHGGFRVKNLRNLLKEGHVFRRLPTGTLMSGHHF